MKDCIFCAIARSDIPSATLWEDERTFAFLDINPLARGHALVIPKAHATKLEDADPADAAALMATAQRITPLLCEATACPDATLAINNGPKAGQEVPHLHMHIIPRADGDAAGPIHALFAHRPDVDQDELASFAQTIRDQAEA